MARERLLPTLTWHPKGLMQPWTGPAPHGPRSAVHGASPGGCTRLLSVLPSPPRPPGWRLHQRPTDPVAQTLLCITAGYFPHQEKLVMVPQAWGNVVKSSQSSWL